MKHCPRCGLKKPHSDFHRSVLRADGLQSICKSCRADVDHARYEVRIGHAVARQPQGSERGRTAWLTSRKAGQPCTDCREFFPHQVLQWDHRPGFQKLGEISVDFWGLPREAVLAEIAKCEIVCANCHAIRTFSRRGWGNWAAERIDGLDTRRDGWFAPPFLRRPFDDVPDPSNELGPADGRLCVMCVRWKALADFHNSRTGQFSYCRECRRGYDRWYYRERGKPARSARNRERIRKARVWMAALKDGTPCTDCARVFPVWAMHWDHLPEFQKVCEISVMVSSRTRAAVLEELEKCELVCANCHVIRTVRRAKRAS